jgi:hypothetical protein
VPRRWLETLSEPMETTNEAITLEADDVMVVARRFHVAEV